MELFSSTHSHYHVSQAQIFISAQSSYKEDEERINYLSLCVFPALPPPCTNYNCCRRPEPSAISLTSQREALRGESQQREVEKVEQIKGGLDFFCLWIYWSLFPRILVFNRVDFRFYGACWPWSTKQSGSFNTEEELHLRSHLGIAMTI